MPISQMIPRFHNLFSSDSVKNSNLWPLSWRQPTQPPQNSLDSGQGIHLGCENRIRSLCCFPQQKTGLGSCLFALQPEQGQLPGWSPVKLHPLLTNKLRVQQISFSLNRKLFFPGKFLTHSDMWFSYKFIWRIYFYAGTAGVHWIYN